VIRSALGAGPARIALSLSGVAALVALWSLGLAASPHTLLPGPWAVVKAIAGLAASGLLVHHVVASLFRVTWGYLAAVAVALPAGLLLGTYRRPELAFGPFLELARPISPLAWIPLSILWLGVGDLAALAIIFFASFLPLVLTVKNAVGRVPLVHLQAGRNFGLAPGELARRILLPAILPQVLVGLRLSLGVAWLVVVAAEMLAVNSGLGFLIIDARNAGNRYDLVVAGMVLIGGVGLALDTAILRLGRLPAFAWGASER